MSKVALADYIDPIHFYKQRPCVPSSFESCLFVRIPELLYAISAWKLKCYTNEDVGDLEGVILLRYSTYYRHAAGLQEIKKSSTDILQTYLLGGRHEHWSDFFIWLFMVPR